MGLGVHVALENLYQVNQLVMGLNYGASLILSYQITWYVVSNLLLISAC